MNAGEEEKSIEKYCSKELKTERILENHMKRFHPK